MTACQQILCGNPDHSRRVTAIARLAWPNGDYKPTTACRRDLSIQIAVALEDGLALTIDIPARTP